MAGDGTHRDLVVIGGSSGATDALRQMSVSLPESLNATFFIALHLPSDGVPMLATMTSLFPSRTVKVAEHGMPITPGYVYLAPPDYHLLLGKDELLHGRGPRENMSRPAVDALFRSAAVNHGARVLGVVLSGLLNDGAAGAHAIKRCGGVVAVQEPDDALEPDMPLGAIAGCPVDVVASAASLGEVIADLLREPAGWPVPIPAELQLEVEIAAGTGGGSETTRQLADPVALTCPACGGVMSQLRGEGPLRYRCQVGHAMTAEIMARQQEGAVDEALRLALRVLEERAELVSRMAREGKDRRPAIAAAYEQRAKEYRSYAQTLRQAVIQIASLSMPHIDDEPSSA